MKHLNLNALRVFAIAALFGNFQRAADELNISHGAISQGIKQPDQVSFGAFLRLKVAHAPDEGLQRAVS